MIDALKRKLGITPAPAQAETEKEEVNMDVTDNANEVAQLLAQDVAGLQASLASMATELAAANAKNTELSALVEAATEFNATKEKAAAEAKLVERKLQVTKVVGTIAADNVMTAIAALDDKSFSTVLAAMALNTEKESTTALFVESGVAGQADKEKLQAEADSNGTMAILQAKYHQSN